MRQFRHLCHILILASNYLFIRTVALTTTSKERRDVRAASSNLHNAQKKQNPSPVNYSLEDAPRRTFLKELGRGVFASSLSIGMSATSFPKEASAAKPDCMSDCLKNCKLIAPKDTAYCLENCTFYCAQEDRTDGLSGSVSDEGGEMGILGINTVVKGEDKPPSIQLPGLDFLSDNGRKLIGY